MDQDYLLQSIRNGLLFLQLLVHTHLMAGSTEYYYKLVLEIDPQHEEAQKGSEDIFDTYVVLINKAIKNNETGIAKSYLDRAKTILPGSSSHQAVIEYLSESLEAKSEG